MTMIAPANETFRDTGFHEDLCLRYRMGERLDFFFFWGHNPGKGLRPGEADKSCLSQWHNTSFEVDGKRFATAEHFMMYSKADLFGDEEVKTRVFENPDPRDAKALGRAVRGFDEKAWKAHRYPIVLKGTLAKFSQNEAARNFLLQTGDSILVEASPYDGVWGIKMDAQDPRATDPTQWRGPNLLGFALTQARSALRLQHTSEAQVNLTRQVQQEEVAKISEATQQSRTLGFRRFSRP